MILIYEGKISGIIDIDWMGLGDMLTFAAMTKVALLNMDLDTKYIDYLLEEVQPNTIEYKAFVFYCLLDDIFDILLEEWNKCCER